MAQQVTIGKLVAVRKRVPVNSAAYKSITQQLERCSRMRGITIGDDDSSDDSSDNSSNNTPSSTGPGQGWPASTWILIFAGTFLAGAIVGNSSIVRKAFDIPDRRRSSGKVNGIGGLGDTVTTLIVLGGVGYGVYSYATKGFIYTFFNKLFSGSGGGAPDASAGTGTNVKQVLKDIDKAQPYNTSNAYKAGQATAANTAAQDYAQAFLNEYSDTDGVEFQLNSDGVTISATLDPGTTVSEIDDDGSGVYGVTLSNGELIAIDETEQPALYNFFEDAYTAANN
jgi:hypothetical protein